MTAGVISYNVRELSDGNKCSGNGDATHPLLQETVWKHDIAMLTKDDADAIDRPHLGEAAA